MSLNKASEKKQNETGPSFEWHFLGPRYWATWFMLFLFFLFSMLPLALIDFVGRKLGELIARRNKKRFNIASTNLSLCFPDKSEKEINAMVVEHFRFQTRSLLHYGLIWWAPVFRIKKHITLEGFKQIDELKKQGKNVIALTLHSAGLEFAVTALSMYTDSSGPYKPMRNEVIDWWVIRGRKRFGGRLLTRGHGFRPLIKDAREGRLLVYLADEDLGADVSVFVPFFGVQKATVPVLGRLSKSCNAKVLPCISCYDPERHKYVIKLLPPIENFPSGDDAVDAASMNAGVESAVRQCVVQYLWTLRLFQTRPPGEESLYE
jgi:lauroyl-KDO2-lipid IV(A) myristoyltransferase